MTDIVFLMRESLAGPEEVWAARKACVDHDHAQVMTLRTEVQPNDLVVCRYSLLPYHREVQAEIRHNHAIICQPSQAHEFLADATRWAPVLGDMTPAVYGHWAGLSEGQYVVKGKTNSKKNDWATMMYCPTVADIPIVARRLLEDTYIGQQGLVVRPYVPLRKLGEGLNGLPITNEWRVFCWDGKAFAAGFYWGSEPFLAPYEKIRQEGLRIALQAARLCQPYDARFVAVDVAETESGAWIVIEVNDGQMSGLGCIDPNAFYENLLTAIDASPFPSGDDL